VAPEFCLIPQAFQEEELSEQEGQQALLLLCDCGAKYLCIDGADRKKVGAWATGGLLTDLAVPLLPPVPLLPLAHF
jgi:hypothetical protein